MVLVVGEDGDGDDDVDVGGRASKLASDSLIAA